MHTPTPDHPVIAQLDQFDPRSGSAVERLLFNHRVGVLIVFVLLTALLGWQALGVRLNPSFERMIPARHPFVQNYQAHKADLAGLGNTLRVAVASPDGTIYSARYMETLRQLSDELFLVPGVDRSFMKSIWMPSVRWIGVTEEGLDGGPVIPDGFDGSPARLAELRANIERSGEIGALVAPDFKSSVIVVPLLDTSGAQRIDYAVLSDRLEQLRAKYEAQGVRIHITGFAKVVGDLIDGMRQVLLFFAVALAICAGVLLWYTRCVRSTLLVVACSLVASLWLLGALPLLGFDLDPYSVLLPFLVFAIGMSHGAQKMNGIMQDIGRGAHRLVAARYTFRRLFLAGLTALLADAVGFAVLMVIDIPVIHDLAIAASVGVAMLIFTNLILLPVLLSYTGVSAAAAQRSLRDEEGTDATGAPR
jgi:predicted RND superfamily exporter protein